MMAEVNLRGSEILSSEEAARFFPDILPDPLEAPVIETPTGVLFDPLRDRTFRVPVGLTDNETEFVLARDGDGVSAGNFVGPYNVGEILGGVGEGAQALGAGALGRLLETTKVPDIRLKQKFESSLELLQGELSFDDFITGLNPLNVNLGDLVAKIRGGEAQTKRIKETETALASVQEAIAKKDRQLRLLGLERPEEGGVVGFLFDLGSGATSLIAALGIGVVTKSPVLVAAVFGVVQQTELYQEYRARVDAGGNQKFTPSEARGFANIGGIVEGALEGIGIRYLLKFLSLPGRFRRIITSMLTEFTQETAQQTGEEVLTQVTGARDVDIKAGAGRVLYAGALGAILGGGTGAVVSLTSSVAEEEGLSPELARALADKVVENTDLLKEEAANILTELDADIAINPKAREQVAEIIRKFVNGEEINLEAVLGKGGVDVAATLAGLIEGAAQKRDISKEIEAGRIAELTREISALDQQIGDTETRIEEREATDKPVKSLQNRLDKLAERRRTFEEEQADLQVPPTRAGLLPEFEPALREKRVKPESQVRIKAKILEKLNIRTTAAVVAAVRKGFREGIKTAKRDVKEAQTILTTLIEKSGLEAKDKAKFIRTISNIQTLEQLEKRLPGIQSRVIGLLDSERRVALRAALKKTVRKTKPRKISGKPVGKFTPEVQIVLDKARETLRLSVGEAAARLEARLEQEVPDASADFENALLAVAARDENMSADTIEALLVDLNRVKTGGAAEAKRLFLARKEQEKQTIAEASQAVTQGKDIDLISTVGLAKRIAARARETRAEFNSWWDGWDEMLSKILDKKDVDADALIKRLRATRPLQNVKARLIGWEAELEALGLKAFGFDNQAQLIKRFYQDSVRKDLGEFVDASGRKVRLEYTVAEARKLWMEMQDETISPVITHEKGNAFTDEMTGAIFDLLSQEDVAYARAQLGFLRKIYGQINTVYRRMYGVDLPFNEFYSHVIRDRAGKPITEAGDSLGADQDSFFDEMTHRRRLPSALKSRDPNILPLGKQSDIGSMHKHLHDMAHFIETGEHSRFLNNVFSNARLRKEIARLHGNGMVGQIDSFLQDYNRGYLTRGIVAERQINYFNRVFSLSVLAAKAIIGMKQTTSLFAMAENIPTSDFYAGLLDYAENPRKVTKFLFESSPLMQKRTPSLDLEMARLGSAKEQILRFRRLQTLPDQLMIMIRLGDRFPIYAGGWARYKYNRKKGMSHQDAMADFEDAVASTQQSVDIDKLSNLQRAGGLGRTVTLFMTSRLALFRGEARAIREFRRGKITAREFGKRMAYYHFIMPSLIQFIVSGLKFEPERQYIALLLGQLNNVVIFSDILMTAALAIFAEDRFRGVKEVPLFEFFREAMDGVIDAFDATDSEEFMEAVGELSDTAGKIVGLPVEQARNATIGGVLLTEGKFEEGGKRILGWSARIAKESSE